MNSQSCIRDHSNITQAKQWVGGDGQGFLALLSSRRFNLNSSIISSACVLTRYLFFYIRVIHKYLVKPQVYKIDFFCSKYKMGEMLKFMYLLSIPIVEKKSGWVGFQKYYVIFRLGHYKCLHLLTRWVGGVKKGPKTCLRNI